MVDKYTNNIDEITNFGLNLIDSNETVNVNLKDLMFIHATLQEYQRFFHQPLHWYNDLDDMKNFMQTYNDKGGLKILQKSINKMRDMIPSKLDVNFGNGDFDDPTLPFYYEEKRHE